MLSDEGVRGADALTHGWKANTHGKIYEFFCSLASLSSFSPDVCGNGITGFLPGQKCYILTLPVCSRQFNNEEMDCDPAPDHGRCLAGVQKSTGVEGKAEDGRDAEHASVHCYC